MKTIFVILLCGLSTVLGKFNCNQDYPKECTDPSGKTYDSYPETAADLEDFCKAAKKDLTCQLDYAIECPNTLTGATRHVIEDFLYALNRICNKNDPMYQEYLENIHCLNEETDSRTKDCETTVKEREYCKRSYEVLKCTEDALFKTCGEDVKELVELLFKQKYSMVNVFCQ